MRRSPEVHLTLLVVMALSMTACGNEAIASIPRATCSLTPLVKRVRRARITGMEAQVAAISVTVSLVAAAYRA
ncbi:MAG TPA: hypothetical protein VI320_10960, partial [Terracidiphilus sp.]